MEILRTIMLLAAAILGSTKMEVVGFKVLAFYRGTWDLAHISFVGDANKYFPIAASQNGFIYESTTDWSRLNDNELANTDVVLFLDDKPTDGNQKSAFQRYMERGGGFIGFHVSAFTQNNAEWSWYHNTLLGSGDYYGNTWRPTSAVLQVEGSHPSTANLPSKFTTQPNEWYSWSNDLRLNPNIQILLSIHEDSFPLGTGPKEWEIWYGGYYPVVWTNKNYRMMYVNMGHNDIAYESNNEELSHTFDNEVQNRLIIDGLKWLAYQRKEEVINKSPLLRAFSA